MSLSKPWRTVAQLSMERSRLSPDETLYTYLTDGEDQAIHLTYAELDRQARNIAAALAPLASPGDRALLLYQPGLEFICAFLGCLYAGLVAVPAFPPRNARGVPRISTIAQDAGATLCLTSSQVLRRTQELVESVQDLEKLTWLATDQCGASEDWVGPSFDSEALAYLQYTSGSTSEPKGVMVTHGNLLHNLGFLCDGRNHTRIVSWLPFFHDMGLIYGILQSLYGGFPCVLMAPASFLQRPFRWLRTISKYQASTTIAPNFAYELCVARISDEEKKTLDLSHWTMALNAAEPVRLRTLERFAEAFAPCGFRSESLRPAYGLAEATLGVSISAAKARYWFRTVDPAELGKNRAIPIQHGEGIALIGCGQGPADQTIAIVNPETRERCAKDEIGEIWLSSPSVARGYWNRPAETEETFRARLATGEGPFLRTGDLGLYADDELIITGRLKDLIIIRGANHYPQDIERTIQASHAALQPDSGAAFSVEVGGEEKLVVVQELARHAKVSFDEIVAAARESIAETHGLQLHALVLVKPLTVPKTSSGKIQRQATRTAFLAGTIDFLHRWEAGTEVMKRREATTSLTSWFVRRLSEMVGLSEPKISPQSTFAQLGLDSIGATSLAGELESRLGRPLPASLLFDYPTIERLGRFLEGMPSVPPHPALSPNGGEGEGSAPAGIAEPIAIIGMACRFPGARDVAEFWELLRHGRDAVTEAPEDRWHCKTTYDAVPGKPGKMSTKWGGFVRDVDQFDAGFFEISPREAEQMDPQQRLLLETAWQALEDAGVPPTSLAGSATGVFVGISSFDYSLLQLREAKAIDAYACTGLSHSIAANRISYALDLRGPSVAIDTACSSSLVAIHEACESLRRGASHLAIAGGVNLLLSPELTIALSHARMMAADGKCKTFDARADGYVRGEGCGVIVLKLLSTAQAEGDHIQALILGSAVNQDGRTNGLTAPSGPAQEAVIRAALDQAGVRPAEIGCVECHGTGTALGDAQEVEALHNVIGRNREKENLVWIGSVKTNIGHLEAAAGVAGVIKGVLQIREGLIPPLLHLRQVNPHLRLDQRPFAIASEPHPWNGTGRKLTGVSSFGFGGTNAHLILSASSVDDHLRRGESDDSRSEMARPLHLLALSAKEPGALQELAKNMEEQPGTNSFTDVCFTANAGRSHFAERMAVVAASGKEAQERLAQFRLGRPVPGVHHGKGLNGRRPKVAFLFTGQGSQYAGMGRELYETEPAFRRTIDQCDEILRDKLKAPLLAVLYPSHILTVEGSNAGTIHETAFAQPALFALEYALARLWQSWGIEPEALLGHSVGEYVAVCLAGTFDLEEGIRLVAQRAQLMDALPRNGAMTLLFASEVRAAQIIREFDASLSIAAVNGPNLTVISGLAESMTAALDRCKAEGIAFQSLEVSHAFHSPLLEPMLDSFEAVSRRVAHRAPRVRIVSNVTGTWMEAAPEAHYWRRHIREPVRFAQGIETLINAGFTHFVECGPVPTLLTMAQRGPRPGPDELAWLPSLKRGGGDWTSFLESLARLYVDGAEVNWRGFDSNYSRRVVSIPGYPFQRRRYWVESPEAATPAEDASWSGLVAAGEKAATAGCEGFNLEKELAKLEALNRLGDAFLNRALKKLGIEPGSDLGRSAILPRYRKAVAGWIRSGPQAEGVENPTQLWPAVAELWKSELFLPQLARQCGQQLTEVLRGEVDPLTIIFHKGSSAEMERIYAESMWARYCNGIVQSIIRARCQSLGQAEGLGILEIGAGTGATTRSILSLLPPSQTRYAFTDLGPNFLQTAREKFSDYPFLEFLPLDIENEPTGFAAESFDLIVAANVLHATKNLRDTLSHVRSLLKPGGLLLLWEATQPQRWMDISFSTLEGWQRFEDFDLRPHQPLLAPEKWMALLRESGFDNASAFPPPGSPPAGLGQSVILAKANGARLPTSPGFVAERARPQRRATSPDLFYKVEWVPAPQLTHELGSPLHYLILADRSGVGERVGQRVEQAGGMAFVALLGDQFEQANPNRFSIRATKSDLERLVGMVSNAATITHVLYLWSLNLDDEVGVAAFKRAQAICCEAPSFLLRALLARSRETVPRLWFITRGAQPVLGPVQNQGCAAQGLLWGFGRTLAVEHPQYWGGLIDLSPATEEDEAGFLAQRPSLAGDEDQFARRGGEIFVPRLVRDSFEVKDRFECNANGSYLITGGMGGIGLRVARWLIDRGARRIVLASRTALPPRTQWSSARNKEGLLAGRIEEVLRLEALGATVETVALDVGNIAQVEAFVRQQREELRPPIRGLFHAAGLIEDLPIAKLEREAAERILRPKVLGSWSLLQGLVGEPIEHVALFSSAASLLGSADNAAYTAANAFLDSWASLLRAQNIQTTVIDWGAWEQVGMAKQNRRGENLEAHGVSPIPVTEALDALGHCLMSGSAQHAVCSIHWPRLFDSSARAARMPMLDQMKNPGNQRPPPSASPLRSAEPERNEDGVKQEMVECIAALLKTEPQRIDPARPLYALGMDSIMAVQLRNEFELRFATAIPIREIVESSVNQLAVRLRGEDH